MADISSRGPSRAYPNNITVSFFFLSFLFGYALYFIFLCFCFNAEQLIKLYSLQPDLVAPGYAVLTSHPSTVEVNQKEREEDSSIKKLMKDHKIVNGTSVACPLVAAYALVVCAHHPDWKPSAIKSALITTGNQDYFVVQMLYICTILHTHTHKLCHCCWLVFD